jgi:catechol 2,3-dioxygenase-like lactoylglutathione lyase family enzyme
MAVELDHLIVPSKDRDAAAKQLADLLGVDWAPAGVGSFTAVYVNAGLTLDFDEWQDEIPQGHYCFRVDELRFDAVLDRIRHAGIPYRSMPHGADDYSVNTGYRGRIVYWNEPDGHVWELLTESYARKEVP